MEKLWTTGNLAGRCIAMACWLLLPTMAPAAELAPPTTTVTAERAGRLLTLGCELRNADGSEYHPENRENPPQFAVYQGDTLIGSGSFEYG